MRLLIRMGDTSYTLGEVTAQIKAFVAECWEMIKDLIDALASYF